MCSSSSGVTLFTRSLLKQIHSILIHLIRSNQSNQTCQSNDVGSPRSGQVKVSYMSWFIISFAYTQSYSKTCTKFISLSIPLSVSSAVVAITLCRIEKTNVIKLKHRVFLEPFGNLRGHLSVHSCHTCINRENSETILTHLPVYKHGFGASSALFFSQLNSFLH